MGKHQGKQLQSSLEEVQSIWHSPTHNMDMYIETTAVQMMSWLISSSTASGTQHNIRLIDIYWNLSDPGVFLPRAIPVYAGTAQSSVVTVKSQALRICSMPYLITSRYTMQIKDTDYLRTKDWSWLLQPVSFVSIILLAFYLRKAACILQEITRPCAQLRLYIDWFLLSYLTTVKSHKSLFLSECIPLTWNSWATAIE